MNHLIGPNVRKNSLGHLFDQPRLIFMIISVIFSPTKYICKNVFHYKYFVTSIYIKVFTNINLFYTTKRTQFIVWKCILKKQQSIGRGKSVMKTKDVIIVSKSLTINFSFGCVSLGIFIPLSR